MPKRRDEMKTRFDVIGVGRLRRLVYGAMGVTDFKTPLEKAAHPAVLKYLNPFHEIDTPLSRMNHNPLKLPEEHLGKQFGVTGLKWVVLKVPEISAFLRKHPAALSYFNKIFEDAVFFHQVKSPFYWRQAGGTGYLKTITASAEGIPAEMNANNARLAAEDVIIKTFPPKNKTVTLLDVGTGAGGTILPVLERLKQYHYASPEVFGKLKIYLNCLQPNLDEVKEKIAAYGVKKENIITVPTTFYAFSQAMGVRGMPKIHPWQFADAEQFHELHKLRGKVDIIISGASMNNLPRSKLAFDTLHALLKPKGKAFLWDWGGFDLAKKAYSQKELDRTVQTTGGTPVSVRDNIKGFWRFWLYHHGYIDPEKGDEKAWNKLEHYINTAKQVNVLDWFNNNYLMLENRHRKNRDFTELGNANRAYRTPEDVANAAKRSGFKITKITYPLAGKTETRDGKTKWTEPNPRFVTWQAVLEKPNQGLFKRAVYRIMRIGR